VVTRRGRRKKLCARGAHPARSSGPPLSPLDVRNPYAVPNVHTTGFLVIATICALALCGTAVLLLAIRAKARRLARGRASLDAAAFSALFPSASEAAVAPVIRDLLKRYISIPPGLVRPDDRLCADLGLAAIDGLDANSYVRDVEEAVGVTIPDADAAQMITLRDVVTYVGAATETRTSNNRWRGP
jgi:acyl carrier protein